MLRDRQAFFRPRKNGCARIIGMSGKSAATSSKCIGLEYFNRMPIPPNVRIAEPSVRFQLPEGRRGIFVGGGATVRVGRILGPDRMREMMLTGRSYGSEEGVQLGLAHYAVEEGKALPLALKLARKIADNAPFSKLPDDTGTAAYR